MEIQLEKPRTYWDWLRIQGVYLAAFPPSERKPFSKIRNMNRQGRADVWRILRDGKFTGFAATVNGAELVLLDYLAVRKSCRGTGIGSTAMALLMAQYADKGLFVEIETTREAHPDLPIRRRRRQFYEKAGMLDLGVSAQVFDVKMDLLGVRCALDFEGYRAFYRDSYSPRAAEHLEPLK